jgi:hypothetical protein
MQCFLRNFSIVYAGSALIYIISSYKRVVSSPIRFITGLFGRKTASFALFTGLLPTLYHVSITPIFTSYFFFGNPFCRQVCAYYITTRIRPHRGLMLLPAA